MLQLKEKGPKKPELVLELEDDGRDINVLVCGYYILSINKSTHKVERIGSVPEQFGFDLDDCGRIVIE